MAGIAVIIPCLDEEAHLPATLAALDAANSAGAADPEWPVEIIVVDAGSSDRSVEIARATGCRVIESPKRQRAHQLNLGARSSEAEVLWFVHADTLVAPGSIARLVAAMRSPELLGGGFRRRFDSPSGHLRWTSWIADLRGRFWKFFYGDQAMFVRRSAFEQLGGFDVSLDVAEDLDFSLRLREAGHVTMLGPPVVASARRFERLGPREQIRRDRQFVKQWMKARGWHDWRPGRRP